MTDTSSRRRLNLTIDRLVLRGVSATQRHAVVASFQAELNRLLAGPGDSFGESYSTAAVRPQPQRLVTGTAQEIGTSGARALFKGLQR